MALPSPQETHWEQPYGRFQDWNGQWASDPADCSDISASTHFEIYHEVEVQFKLSPLYVRHGCFSLYWLISHSKFGLVLPQMFTLLRIASKTVED
jgi:hypothetical protein